MITAHKEQEEVKPKPAIYEELKDSFVLWLNTGVDEDNMALLASQMLTLSAKDPKRDIYLLINSPGGSVTAGVMLYDMMEAIPNDVVTVALGMAASMGQFLLTAGTPGKRFIAKNARVLVHQPHGGYSGTSTDIEIEAALISSMKDQLAGVTASRSGKTLEEIHEVGDRDRWFTAQEAVEFGLADAVIDNIHDVIKGL